MLTNSKSKQKKNILNAVPGSEVIPYKRHVDEYTIKTKKGDYVRIWEVEGVDFLTQSDDLLNSWCLAKQTTWKALAHSKLAVWTHLIHEQPEKREAGKYNNLFCQRVANEYHEKVLGDTYVNRYFISLCLLGDDNLEELRNKIDKGGAIAQEEALRFLHRKAGIINTDFAHTGIKPLKLKEASYGYDSELSQLIGRIYNGTWQEQPVLRSNLCDTITSSGVLIEKEVVEQRGISHNSDYGSLLSVSDFETRTHVNQFNDLLGVPYPFILSQSFTFLDQGKTQRIINRVDKDLHSIGQSNSDQAEELQLLKSRIISGEIIMGSHHITLFSSDKDLMVAVKNLDEAAGILRKGAIIAERTLLDAEPCFLAQLPCNHSEITYSAPITDENFSHFNSFHNFPKGKRLNNHWGDSVAPLRTIAGTVFDFNWHNVDVGNTGIFGAVGSGKTSAENMLILLSQKFNPDGVIFDFKRNAEALIKVFNGEYFNFAVGQNTGSAPMQLKPTIENIEFNKKLIQMLVTSVHKTLTIKDRNDIHDAVESVMSDRVPLSERSLTSLAEFFPNQGEDSLYDRIYPWLKGNELGWVFDNDTDRFNLDSKWVGFSTDEILNMGVAKTPMLAYLFHRIKAKRFGQPFITVIEEYHQILNDPFFESEFEKGLKMDRDKNNMYIYTTQSVKDAVKAKISSALLEQTGTSIFLSNPNGKYSDYEQLNVTKEEFSWIKASSKESRRMLVKQDQETSLIDFNLLPLKEYFPVLSMGKKHHKLFDECSKEFGDNWLVNYLEKCNRV